MDPLSALSLAACIVQFIDFGSKLVCKTKEVAENGSLLSVQDLMTITSDLVDISSTLRVRTGGSEGPPLPLSDVEKVGHLPLLRIQVRWVSDRSGIGLPGH